MKAERIYEIELSADTSLSIDVALAQNRFMSAVFELAKESKILGHGLEITMLNADVI